MVENPLHKKIPPLYLAGGAVGVIVIYIGYSRSKKNALAAASTAAATPTTDPNTAYVDPNAGLDGSYGSYGYGGAYGAVPGSPYSYSDPASNTTITVPTSNMQWFQQAESYLTGNGYDALATSAALGKYLAGQALTSDQLSIVQSAIGAEGNPPQAVPPPHIIPSGGAPGTTNPNPVANGWYRNIVNGEIDQVQNGKRYHVKNPAEWAKIQQQLHPQVTPTLPNSPVWTLPLGGQI